MPFSLQSLQCSRVLFYFFFVFWNWFERLADTDKADIRAALANSFYLFFHYTRSRPRQYFCRAYSQQKNIQIYSFMIQCSALMFCLILKAKKILCGILGRLKSLTLSTAWAKQKLNMQVSPLNVSMHTFFFLNFTISGCWRAHWSEYAEKKTTCCGQAIKIFMVHDKALYIFIRFRLVI